MRRKPTYRDIHPSSRFEEIIRYERARADRSGSGFALVSLELGTAASRRRDLRRLIRALRRRVRSTDAIGWQDEQTLSVLLPGTDRKGGENFAANFGTQHYGKRTPPPFTIRCHPEGWSRGGAVPSTFEPGSVVRTPENEGNGKGRGKGGAKGGSNGAGSNGAGVQAFRRIGQ